MKCKATLKKLVLFFVLLVFTTSTLYSQYSTVTIGKKNLSYKDSIKQIKYDYILPIWGQKVYEKGFDIPYPVGGMVNYLWMKQDLDFTNFQLGYQNDNQGIDIPLTPVDFIQFGEIENISQAVNFRPDIWVLPFFNIYGLFGKGTSKTSVNLVAPIDLLSVVEQDITTKGFGVMGAGGIGKFWFSVDGNWTWSKPQLLDKAVQVKVLGLRVGQTFKLKKKPQSNLAYWFGAMRVTMDSGTSGAIKMSDAIPGLGDRAQGIVEDYDAWKLVNYDGLDPLQQKVVDDVFDPLVSAIGNVDGEAIIKYAMDKQVHQKWNLLAGGQYQINKNWQIRSEAGFIGNRKSFLISFNYRFRI